MNGSTSQYVSIGYKYTHIVLDVLLLVLICAGNILTIVSIQRKKTMTHKITNKLVLNLACADLMVGLTAPLHAVLFVISDVYVFKMFCLVQDAMATVAMGASLYSLLLIAIERYMGICHPLQRQRWLSVHTIHLCIAGTWIYTILCVVFIYFFQQMDAGMPCLMSFYFPVWVYEGIICTNVLFVVGVSCTLYGRVFYIAKTSHNKMVLYRSISLRAHPGPRAQLPDDLLNSIHSNKKPWQQAMKVNIVMAMVMGAFIITWIPFMMTSSLRLGLKMSTPSWIMAEETLMMMAAVNSSLNPFIYAWKFRDFRWAYKKAILTPMTKLRKIGSGHVT